MLFHSGSLSVDETTYLAIELMCSLTGSPERVGHTGAKASFVRRPISNASQPRSSSACISSPLLPRLPIDGHSCGRSITPSSVMYVELMILRIQCISRVSRVTKRSERADHCRASAARNRQSIPSGRSAVGRHV